MKRRDFLKGMLGAVGAGIGATKLLPEAQVVESVEVVEESPIIDTMRVFGEEHAIGLRADGTTLEIPMNFVIDNATAEQLSKNENLKKMLHSALKDLETKKVVS
jgi:hypothetical protein